jgi:acetyl esterase/lipase
VHGGGYVQGSAASTILSAAIVAHEAGAKVVSIDYTVAPDLKWQQITDQVISVLEAMKGKHISMKNVAMFGDSAGGGLVAGAVLKARDQGKSVPAALVLWSPWADITDTGDTYRTLRQTDFLTYESLRQGALAYADAADQKLPYVSPVYGDYGKPFPPTLIQGGLREIFLSDFVRLYQALDSSGREVKLDLYEAMPHVFQAILSDTDESRNAVRKTVRFMKDHISKTAK